MQAAARSLKCRPTTATAGAGSARWTEDSGRKGDTLLGLLHAVGRTDSDTPLIHPARRPGPVFRASWFVALADAGDFGGVLDNNLIRPDEIREDIIARPMPSDAPFDCKAAFAQTAGAAHDTVDIRHFERDMVERRRRAARERQDVMLIVATEERHRPRLVDDAESEMVDVERADRVDIGGIEHDMRDTHRPVRPRGRVGMAPVTGDDPHGPALGILERKTVSTARFVDGPWLLEFGKTRFFEAGMDSVDLGLARRREIDAQQLGARPGMEAEDVVVCAGATQIDRAGMLDHRRQAPDVAVEPGPRLEVGDAEVDAAQTVDSPTFGARAAGCSGFSRRFQWFDHGPPLRQGSGGARHVRTTGACVSRLRLQNPILYI